MSGKVNSTGAVSGIVGTTVGTPSGGKVVQVTAQTGGNSETNCAGGDNTWRTTVVTQAITPLNDDSKIIVMGSAIVLWTNSSTDCGYSLGWGRTISGGSLTRPTSMTYWGDGSNSHGNSYSNNPTGDLQLGQTHTMQFQDAPNTLLEVTYVLQCSEYHMEAISVGGCNTGRWSMYIIEVAA